MSATDSYRTTVLDALQKKLDDTVMSKFCRRDDCTLAREVIEQCMQIVRDTPEPESNPEHLQDAPLVRRNSFKVPNPFPHDPKKEEQREITVVFASFAACLERAKNQAGCYATSSSTEKA